MSEILLCVDLGQRRYNRGVSVDDMISEAEQLFSLGYTRAAAIIGRAALEAAIKARAHLENCFPSRLKGGALTKPRHTHPTAHDCICMMARADKIDRLTRRRLTRALHIGNYAAHGSDPNAELCLQVVMCAKQMRASLGPCRAPVIVIA